MPTLTIRTESGEHPIRFEPGKSLRHLLDATDYRVRCGCRKMGACGLCRVRILAGETGDPTPNEELLLGKALLSEGVRLACQIVPLCDLSIAIFAPAATSAWRPLNREDLPLDERLPVGPVPDLPPEVTTPYGVAVDLGTTHISVSIFELTTGRWLSGSYGSNPQAVVGADVMTRLVAAVESPEQMRDLQRLAVDAIGEALTDAALRDGLNLQQVVRLTLVGNTAMLALLSGRNAGLLLQPNQWMESIDCLPLDAGQWISGWGIDSRAQVEILPPLAGFVGSDLLAGVLATRLTERAAGSLLIDFGTKTEIALWDGRDLWVTSAAGGPAFEGSGVRHGLPAEPGAISRVAMPDGVPQCTVIGGGEPQGLCGTGLVDLIAELVGSGALTEKGLFASNLPPEGFALTQGAQAIVLSKADIDLFQRAKAAIGVGIQVLLERAGMGYGGLQRIFVSGAFGAALDIAHAGEVGLLPKVPPDRVELCGNTALTGCERALLSPDALLRLEHLSRQAKIINLAHHPEFPALFLEQLYLRPCREGAK